MLVYKILQFALFISNQYLFSNGLCNASHVLDPNRTHTDAVVRSIIYIYSELSFNK